MKVDWKRPTLMWLCAACLPGLILGVLSYYWTVGPLEKKLMEYEVRGLAGEINTIINVRASAIGMGAANLDIDNLTDAGALDKLLSGIRDVFPDFLSMEIIDGHGEILAMMGELPLSEAGRSAGRGKSSRLTAAHFNESETFTDNPSAGCFLITAKHKAGDGAAWFTRSRFSRDHIEQILASGKTGLPARLVFAPAEGRGASQAVTNLSPGVSSQWSGADVLEARLALPGWVVKLDTPSKGPLLKYLIVIGLALVGIAASLAFAVRGYAWVIDRNQWASARSRSLGAGSFRQRGAPDHASLKPERPVSPGTIPFESQPEPPENAMPLAAHEESYGTSAVQLPADSDTQTGEVAVAPSVNESPTGSDKNRNSTDFSAGQDEAAGAHWEALFAKSEEAPSEVCSRPDPEPEEPSSIPTVAVGPNAGEEPEQQHLQPDTTAAGAQQPRGDLPQDAIPEYLELTWCEPVASATKPVAKDTEPQRPYASPI